MPEALARQPVSLHHARVPWANSIFSTVLVHSVGDTAGFNTGPNSDF